MSIAGDLLRFIDPDSGPITRIVSSPYPGFLNRAWWHSSAFLHKENAEVVSDFEVFNSASGGAWSRDKEESQVKAIVEAIERWAFYYSYKRSADIKGFELDATTNGFAALPSVYGENAVRERAYCEALERWFLDRVWYKKDVLLSELPIKQIRSADLFANGKRDVHVYVLEIAGVLAGFLSGKKLYFCLSLYRTEFGGVLPGSSCGADFEAVVDHAVVELYANFLAFEKIKKSKNKKFCNLIEARLQYFGTDRNGFASLADRFDRGKGKPIELPSIVHEAVFDGPWNPEVNVRRILLDQSVPFFADGENRFMM